VVRRVVFVLGIVSALGTILLVVHALANRVSGNGAGLPVSTAREEGTDLYGHPQPVTIEGYSGRAMEPFIAPDGKTLFFNNSNEPGVDTNLHVATRLGPNAFRHVGELTGANSPVLDAVPSMDLDGRFYFTSVRQYDRDLKSIFVGQFSNGAVERVHAVEGNFSPTTPGWVNMDVEVSQGRRHDVHLSRSLRGRYPGPTGIGSDGGPSRGRRFTVDPRSHDLLAKVNTTALEYAPAISADGLELYFTRAKRARGRRSGKCDAGNTGRSTDPDRVRLRCAAGARGVDWLRRGAVTLARRQRDVLPQESGWPVRDLPRRPAVRRNGMGGCCRLLPRSAPLSSS
jgi:hypothetical protein